MTLQISEMVSQILEPYKGREQAYIKHQLLRGYLEQLIMIIGHTRASCITFVDGFAGPWQDESETLGTTSIAISLDIMRRCHDAFAQMGKAVPKFRALFIEDNRTRYKRLQEYLASSSPACVETRALHGKFLD